MKQSNLHAKVPPLREINLNSRPFARHTIAFSSDGELAVGADDSVLIFAPDFPNFKSAPKRATQPADGQDGNAGRQAVDANEAENPANDKHRTQDGSHGDQEDPLSGPEVLRQFSGIGKRIPVTNLDISPRVNTELFAAVGMPCPWDRPGLTAHETTNLSVESDFEDERDPDEEDSKKKPRGHFSPTSSSSSTSNIAIGTGSGPVTGTGHSLKLLISLAWSPSGLGLNRRPVLAVLVSPGTLAVYGDGDFGDNDSDGSGNTSRARLSPPVNDSLLRRRDIGGWKLLWGIGGRLTVPNQKNGFPDNVYGFAWAKDIAIGQALLAYVNDTQEIAIISIQSVLMEDLPTRKPKAKAKASNKASGSRLVWRVQEILRFRAMGPHPEEDVMDPDYTPRGTSFGINWGPWLEQADGSRVCLLSYIDRNYVGFRRVTIDEPWPRGELPRITVSTSDVTGYCLTFSNDGYVVFENAIWTKVEQKVCRGIIVTGFYLQPFELNMLGNSSFHQTPHTLLECKTNYYTEELESPNSNPITGLIIHPPNPLKPTPTPIYTLIRYSASSNQLGWYETNAHPPEDVVFPDKEPQWVVAMTKQLCTTRATNMSRQYQFRTDKDNEPTDRFNEDIDDDNLPEDDDSELEYVHENEDDSSEDESKNIIPRATQAYPLRFCLWGIAASPGGGVSAVLASPHSASFPEKGGFSTMRSTVYFGFKPRAKLAASNSARESSSDNDSKETSAEVTLPFTRHMSTEGRLFEWMYGHGPEVPGIISADEAAEATTAAVTAASKDESAARVSALNARRTALLQPLVHAQKCTLCGSAMRPPSSDHDKDRKGSWAGRGGTVENGPGVTRCERGHFFGTCGTSGLAIQSPGTARTCGACGARTLRVQALLAKFPDSRHKEVMQMMTDEVCGRCGGKFLN